MTLYVEAGYDLADLGGYELAVVETGGNTFTVSLPTGKHFLRTNGATVSIFGDFTAMVTPYTDLVGAIETALNLGTAAGAYSVTFDPTTQRVTIAHDGTAPVTAIALTGLTTPGLIGQTVAHSGALSHEMDRTPDYWISGSIGFWSDYHEREGGEDIGFTVLAHNGRPHGVAKEGASTELNLTVPLEPRAIVYTAHSVASDPWTWQKLFRHARNVDPIAIDDGTLQHFVKLRDPRFDPLRRSADYLGHFDIRIASYLLARI